MPPINDMQDLVRFHLNQLDEERRLWEESEQHLRQVLLQALEVKEWSEEASDAFMSEMAAARARLVAGPRMQRSDSDDPEWWTGGSNASLSECLRAALARYDANLRTCAGMPYDPDAWPLEPWDVERCKEVADRMYWRDV